MSGAVLGSLCCPPGVGDMDKDSEDRSGISKEPGPNPRPLWSKSILDKIESGSLKRITFWKDEDPGAAEGGGAAGAEDGPETAKVESPRPTKRSRCGPSPMELDSGGSGGTGMTSTDKVDPPTGTGVQTVTTKQMVGDHPAQPGLGERPGPRQVLHSFGATDIRERTKNRTKGGVQS